MNFKVLLDRRSFCLSCLRRTNCLFSDKFYLSKYYYYQTGDKLDLENPRRFNEKLQWLKIYYKRPDYTNMVDKYAVKEYVEKKIGSKYIIPTLGVWNSPNEIDFEELPNQFVLKTTHGGGNMGVVICRDKSSFDIKGAKSKLKQSLKSDISSIFREFPYKAVKRRIIAEQYMSDTQNSQNGDLNDYKFYCFNGKAIYCEVIRGRNTVKQIDFFDRNWNHTEFTFRNRQLSKNVLKRPACYDDMLRIADILSEDKPFARIDLYVINDQVYFGEITFFPGAGFSVFNPYEWNYKMGDLLHLPKKLI